MTSAAILTATPASVRTRTPSRWAAAPTGIPIGGRDRFLDLIRVLAIAAVVLQHWALPAMQFRDGQVIVSNALQTPGSQLVTWISQIMPLFFFAGGAANVVSWQSAQRRGKTASAWLSVRVGRLSFPVLAVAALWIPLPYLLDILGAPAGPVNDATFWVARVLWFLPVYLMCVAATPLAGWLAARKPVATLVALVGGAVLVELLRLSVSESFGYANLVFVWLAIHQVGVLYANGQLHFLTPKRSAVIAAGAYATVAALVTFGPYPVMMVALPGSVGGSNQAPPNLCLLVQCVGLLALAMALRPALLALAEKRLVDRAITAVSNQMMTVYIWHMTALMVGAGICVVALRIGTPAGLSVAWWLTLPVWLGLLGVLLYPLIRIFGRLESIRLPRNPDAVGPVRATVATLLVGGGLLGIMLVGFTPVATPLVTGPIPAAAAIALGLVVLSRTPRST